MAADCLRIIGFSAPVSAARAAVPSSASSPSIDTVKFPCRLTTWRNFVIVLEDEQSDYADRGYRFGSGHTSIIFRAVQIVSDLMQPQCMSGLDFLRHGFIKRMRVALKEETQCGSIHKLIF